MKTSAAFGFTEVRAGERALLEIQLPETVPVLLRIRLGDPVPRSDRLQLTLRDEAGRPRILRECEPPADATALELAFELAPASYVLELSSGVHRIERALRVEGDLGALPLDVLLE